MGRIEILTRPGTDRFRGQASFNFNDESLNARNPFSESKTRPSLQTRQYGGNFGGPLSKRKASFFVDFDKRDTDDAALVVAQVLDANNNIVGFNEAFPIPSRRTSFSQSRLPDQREPHADRALQLFEEHSHNRRRRLSTAFTRTTPSKANTVFSSPKQQSSTRRLLKRAFSLNIKERAERRQFHSDYRRAGCIHGRRISDWPVAYGNEWETHQQHFVCNKPFPSKSVLVFVLWISRNSRHRISADLSASSAFLDRPQLVQIMSLSVSMSLASIDASPHRHSWTGLTGAQIRALGGGATQFRLSTGNPETK